MVAGGGRVGVGVDIGRGRGVGVEVGVGVWVEVVVEVEVGVGVWVKVVVVKHKMPKCLEQYRDELSSKFAMPYRRINQYFNEGFDACWKELQKWCPCGGVILADTEDWPIPMCDSCLEFLEQTINLDDE